ncbi:MAG: RNA polymerase sigma factor [Planctomycetes bacterium]|nr:RNA polymerase sigma factor [Planctomycetota bacterium]
MTTPDAKQVFEILIREHADRLMAFACAVCRDRAAADDLFQETLLRAWKGLEEYDRARPFGAWLRGIARNTAYELFRKSMRTVDDAVLNVVAAQADRFDGTQGTEFREQLEVLEECIAALTRPYAETIEMTYRGGLSIERIAEQVSSNTEAVKKRLQRARAMIAECLARKGLLT